MLAGKLGFVAVRSAAMRSTLRCLEGARCTARRVRLLSTADASTSFTSPSSAESAQRSLPSFSGFAELSASRSKSWCVVRAPGGGILPRR
jgi:hypothetical protein